MSRLSLSFTLLFDTPPVFFVFGWTIEVALRRIEQFLAYEPEGSQPFRPFSSCDYFFLATPYMTPLATPGFSPVFLLFPHARRKASFQVLRLSYRRCFSFSFFFIWKPHLTLSFFWPFLNPKIRIPKSAPCLKVFGFAMFLLDRSPSSPERTLFFVPTSPPPVLRSVKTPNTSFRCLVLHQIIKDFDIRPAEPVSCRRFFNLSLHRFFCWLFHNLRRFRVPKIEYTPLSWSQAGGVGSGSCLCLFPWRLSRAVFSRTSAWHSRPFAKIAGSLVGKTASLPDFGVCIVDAAALLRLFASRGGALFTVPLVPRCLFPFFLPIACVLFVSADDLWCSYPLSYLADL